VLKVTNSRFNGKLFLRRPATSSVVTPEDAIPGALIDLNFEKGTYWALGFGFIDYEEALDRPALIGGNVRLDANYNVIASTLTENPVVSGQGASITTSYAGQDISASNSWALSSALRNLIPSGYAVVLFPETSGAGDSNQYGFSVTMADYSDNRANFYSGPTAEFGMQNNGAATFSTFLSTYGTPSLDENNEPIPGSFQSLGNMGVSGESLVPSKVAFTVKDSGTYIACIADNFASLVTNALPFPAGSPPTFAFAISSNCYNPEDLTPLTTTLRRLVVLPEKNLNELADTIGASLPYGNTNFQDSTSIIELVEYPIADVWTDGSPFGPFDPNAVVDDQEGTLMVNGNGFNNPLPDRNRNDTTGEFEGVDEQVYSARSSTTLNDVILPDGFTTVIDFDMSGSGISEYTEYNFFENKVSLSVLDGSSSIDVFAYFKLVTDYDNDGHRSDTVTAGVGFGTGNTSKTVSVVHNTDGTNRMAVTWIPATSGTTGKLSMAINGQEFMTQSASIETATGVALTMNVGPNKGTIGGSAIKQISFSPPVADNDLTLLSYPGYDKDPLQT
jgi:hypothetical protein